MEKTLFSEYNIDYVELYTPMARLLAYWHTQALGFSLTAFAGADTGRSDICSYLVTSGNIKLVLTATFSDARYASNNEVATFVAQNHLGVKRIALQTRDVKGAFLNSISNGAIPLKYPSIQQDADGAVEEAAIRLYDQSELVFINRASYAGAFKPGYRSCKKESRQKADLLTNIDHIAAELRINEIGFWTNYVTNAIGTSLVQRIAKSEENKTGMQLNINQSGDKKLTLVMAEPETYTRPSKVQQNIDAFGPGIHHLAFATDDLMAAVDALQDNNVEFVGFPNAYYDVIRESEDFKGIDIDALQKRGILIDKEGDSYLLQKFIKPVGDRPFFLYELVQRVNGYSGFALKNINVLKKAEEIEIMKA